MNYVITHASVNTTFVLFWDQENPLKIQEIQAKSKDDDKIALVTKQVQPNDVVYMEMGGGSDRLALACCIRGARVFRIPVFKMQLTSDIPAFDEEITIEIDETSDIIEESPAIVQKRKERALTIHQFAIHSPDLFYETKKEDVQILELVVLWKGFSLMVKTRIAVHQRLLSVYRDLYLVDAAQMESGVSQEEYIIEKFKNDPSLALLPPEARKKYLADIKSGDSVFQAVNSREDELQKLLSKKLKKIPIYKTVFADIRGCGDLISARMIGSIGDIRRFETFPKLKAYCGMHHFEDGSRARRKAGKVSNWNTVAKQGCYFFGGAVVKTSSGASEWRILLDKRRGYELRKILLSLSDQFLPEEFKTREVKCVNDMSEDDIDVLNAFCDGLRLEETHKVGKDEISKQAFYQMEYADHPEILDRVLAAYEEGFMLGTKDTKKMCKGIKAKVLAKAQRYIGQRFLRHIYQKWNEALGISVNN